jgi:hypothetical protein
MDIWEANEADTGVMIIFNLNYDIYVKRVALGRSPNMTRASDAR